MCKYFIFKQVVLCIGSPKTPSFDCLPPLFVLIWSFIFKQVVCSPYTIFLQSCLVEFTQISFNHAWWNLSVLPLIFYLSKFQLIISRKRGVMGCLWSQDFQGSWKWKSCITIQLVTRGTLSLTDVNDDQFYFIGQFYAESN